AIRRAGDRAVVRRIRQLRAGRDRRTISVAPRHARAPPRASRRRGLCPYQPVVHREPRTRPHGRAPREWSVRATHGEWGGAAPEPPVSSRCRLHVALHYSFSRMSQLARLGIVGGIAPASTVDYYREVIDVYKRLHPSGDYPRIVINSLNMIEMLGLVKAGRY